MVGCDVPALSASSACVNPAAVRASLISLAESFIRCSISEWILLPHRLRRSEGDTTVGAMKGRNDVMPGDVGRRVSFQYELPNGYVGEVVGNLEWFDEAAQTYVVRDRNEKLHRVPLKG